MKKNLRMSVLILLACASLSMLAAPVDVAAARNVASQYMVQAVAGKMLKSSSASLKLAHAEPWTVNARMTDYYVFNTADGSAFFIISGDDRAEGVLAYGEGSLDMGDLPCNLRCMLDGYKEQLEWLHANPDAAVERAIPYNDVTIVPLLSTTWSQSEPYFNQCPMFQGERSVTGCVATAMAQVMYYWRYPERAPALTAYSTRSHGIYVSSLPNKTLDWDNMLNEYAATPYNAAQADAVATLMRYCGQSVRMDYSPDGSGAYVYQQLSGMKAFGYNPGAQQLQKTNYNYDQWDALLQEELLAGRPILYSANDPAAGGHAFVVDGYFDGKYHVNWGWSGTGNGYFALGAFNVRNYSFLAGQEILYHIYPMNEPSTQDKYDFEVDGIWYRYGEVDGEVEVACRDTKYNSYSGHVTVPASVTVDGRELAVTAVGESAFRNCVDLTAVTLPQSVTRICDMAFLNCVALSSVEIPSGVTTIGQQAFASCLALQSIALPASVKQVAARAFAECQSMLYVVTPDIDTWLSITFADQYANPLSMAHRLIADGHDVKNVVIPGDIGAVNPYAFVDCFTLRSVTIEEGVQSLGASAFSGCSGITSLELPSTLTTLGTKAFTGCTDLTAIIVPEGISELTGSLFSGCSALASVTLPESLTAISSSAFADCSSLTTLVVPDGVTTIGENAFKGCSSLRDISMPASLNKLGASAFESCGSLSSITIPDGVETINVQTFARCGNLVELTLGKSVSVIRLKAFTDSRKLALLTCRGSVPPEVDNPDVFYRPIYDTARLLVPADARPLYKRTGIWPWFKTIIGINVDCPYGDVNGDGEVNIADVNAVIDRIIQGEGSSSLLLDLNGDNEINIADVNTVIDLILR
jgi:hypothetical protein